MATKLLNAVTATGTSGSIPGLFKNHTISVTITGGPSAVTIDVEGSIDEGVTYHQLAQHAFTAGELTATKAMFYIANKSVDAVRHNLTTLTGGSSPTVTSFHRGN